MTATRSWRALSCAVRLVMDDEHRGDQAAEVLVAILARVDRVASRFRADSVLSTANEPAGRPVAIPRDLVGAAMEAIERTAGAVDPTIGLARQGWGYDCDIAELAPDGPAVCSIAQPATWRQIRLDRAAGLLTVPTRASLDLGATAKAFTADFAAGTLCRRHGTPVIVEPGGDLAVAGRRPGGWT